MAAFAAPGVETVEETRAGIALAKDPTVRAEEGEQLTGAAIRALAVALSRVFWGQETPGPHRIVKNPRFKPSKNSRSMP